MNVLKFAVIGGDQRFVFLAKKLIEDNHRLCTYALEESELMSKYKIENIDNALAQSDYVIFGIPSSKDRLTVNTPLSREKIIIDKKLKSKLENKAVFCAKKENMCFNCKEFEGLKLIDYAEDEEFAIKNALLTAQGAIGYVIKNYKSNLLNARCLICGYGRIAKFLAKILRSFNADITVAARRNEALAWVEAMGYTPCNTNRLSDLVENQEFDIAFNTIPSVILNEKILKKLSKDTFIIDLASLPGGVDFAGAEKLNLRVTHLLGVPAKFSPVGAADIIKSVIYKYIQRGGI